jgi:hypothetical protein
LSSPIISCELITSIFEMSNFKVMPACLSLMRDS